MITKLQANALAKIFHLNLNVVPLDIWKYGLNVELEHGFVNDITNVTNDDLIATAKIALAHLLEYPDYYQRLFEMESSAEKYWSKKKKPSIIISNKS